MTLAVSKEQDMVHTLFELTLPPQRPEEALASLLAMTKQEREELMAIASCNHVIVRSLEPMCAVAAQQAGHCSADSRDPDNLTPLEAVLIWAVGNLSQERSRIENALRFLNQVCSWLEANNCPACVMKTLDHWPDFGSDLDLFTTADEGLVRWVMVECLHAKQLKPSWGDRLAHKLNFEVPGLPEPVEIHVQRLGQTGEHTRMAERFVGRRVRRDVGGYTFMAPAPEERIIVATLQRMYRHFFFRISDVLNSAGLVEDRAIDFGELRKAANLGGIWPGVCCYLNIVNGYFERYSGRRLSLPDEVRAAARFGAESTFVRTRFIRVPVMPHSAGLYTRQLAETAARGALPAACRLALLPPLACAAAMSFRLTGSDKGVW